MRKGSLKGEEWERRLRDRLRAFGYRLTPQRMRILETILEAGKGEHLTAREVYERVKRRDSNIGFATVYRALELFTSLGLVNALNWGEGYYRYELSSDKPQYHLVCMKCGKVMDGESPALNNLAKSIADEKSFSVVNLQLYLLGYCEKCRKEEGK